MLCSARELGFRTIMAGCCRWPPMLSVGEDIRRYFDLDDNLITLKLTPNRADCLSLLGIAREVSALTGTPLLAPDVKPVAAIVGRHAPGGARCPRFVLALLRPHHPRRRCPRRDAGVDEAAHRAQRHPLDFLPG